MASMNLPISGDGKSIKPGDYFWVLTNPEKKIYTKMMCTSVAPGTVVSGIRQYAANKVLSSVESTLEGLLSQAIAVFSSECPSQFDREEQIYAIIEQAYKNGGDAGCSKCYDEGYAAGQHDALRWLRAQEEAENDHGIDWGDEISAP